MNELTSVGFTIVSITGVMAIIASVLLILAMRDLYSNEARRLDSATSRAFVAMLLSKSFEVYGGLYLAHTTGNVICPIILVLFWNALIIDIVVEAEKKKAKAKNPSARSRS